jgi:2-C-methyl-D-erythritol 4-phosphate cytidylyltransferase
MSDADLFITKTLDRRRIFRAQTPQAFRKELIKKAYAAFPVSGATDDSALTERLGEKAKIIKGSYGNIKITTMDDLRLAQAILSGNRP